MQLIGIFLVLGSLLFAILWTIKGKPHREEVRSLCIIIAFFGIFFVISDRFVELSIGGIGTIKAAAQKATIDAEQIGEIRKRIESQSATVDLVAKQATETKKLSEDLVHKNALATKQAMDAKKIAESLLQKNALADAKLKSIDETLQRASKSLNELQLISDFSITVFDAQNDDRSAFDKLNTWANDKSYPFSSRAKETWNTIMDAHSSPMYLSDFTIPWSQGVDPTKFTIMDLIKIYESAPSHMRPAFIEYIWKREDFPKKDRMRFLFDVIQHDKSLKAVEYAGRYFTQEAQLKVKPLAVDRLIQWWNENKDKVK